MSAEETRGGGIKKIRTWEDLFAVGYKTFVTDRELSDDAALREPWTYPPSIYSITQYDKEDESSEEERSEQPTKGERNNEPWTYPPSIYSITQYDKEEDSSGEEETERPAKRERNNGKETGMKPQFARRSGLGTGVDARRAGEGSRRKVGKREKSGNENDDGSETVKVAFPFQDMEGVDDGLTELADYIRGDGRKPRGARSVFNPTGQTKGDYIDIGPSEIYRLNKTDEYWNDTLINLWLVW